MQLDSYQEKLDLQMVLFTLRGCRACARLQKILKKIQKESRYQQIELLCFENSAIRPLELAKISPRVFPTVIALKDGKAMLGWEGFASMSTTEISDAIVREALEAVLALSGPDV
jgi:thioredoxin-like negative regulator of GroEL